MACIGSALSPVPRRWNANASTGNGQVIHPAHGDPRGQLPVGHEQLLRSSGCFHGPPRQQLHPQISTRIHPNGAPSAFQQIKSPISQCIDTIIGAADVVDKREALMEEKQPRRSKTSSKKSSVSSKHVTREPKSTKPAGFMDPLELRLEEDKELQKKLILKMALQRPRAPSNPHPTKQPATVIGEGFYWKEYPTLEDILYLHMEEYYDYSTRERQSKHQQAFNNALVDKIRHVAIAQGNEFDPVYFTDKRLRDRIRCFYKTHLQNAKKRLGTLKKHLGSEEHRAALETLIREAHDTPKFENRLIPAVSASDDEACASDDSSDNVEVRPLKKKRHRSD